MCLKPVLEPSKSIVGIGFLPLIQRKNNIKKYFIQLVHLFKEQDFIEDNYKIISNGHYYFTKEFNTHDISEGFVIYEKISI